MTNSMIEVQPGSHEQFEKFVAHGFLYVILDAADAPLVPAKANEMGAAAVSLFAESPLQEYWRYAPYLVKVDAAMLQWLKANLWTTPWGIFLMSNSDLATVSAHLRKLLHLRLKTGEACIFRFYDPRILVSFLTGCTAEESSDFFGMIRAYGVNDKDTLKLLTRKAA